MPDRDDHLRLITKIARMYYERGLRQLQIAEQLNLSQARVSRLLKQAVEFGIVRTIVVPPPGVHSDVEEGLQRRFGLREAVVVDADGATEEGLLRALGAAAANYLDATLKGGDLIGISSWSATLLAAVEAMKAKPTPVAEAVVQIVGGVGNPNVQIEATRLTGRLADLTGAAPVFMPAPGLVGTPGVRRALLRDPAVTEVVSLWERLTMVLVGIGTVDPSPLLRQSGNAMTREDQEELRTLGAVGDVCLRFFDESGSAVRSKLDLRVLGITPKHLRSVDRRIAVAGGERKFSAIRGALLGDWVNILITDLETAGRLLAEGGRAAGGVPLVRGGASRRRSRG